jgi:hypothetical protein
MTSPNPSLARKGINAKKRLGGVIKTTDGIDKLICISKRNFCQNSKSIAR